MNNKAAILKIQICILCLFWVYVIISYLPKYLFLRQYQKTPQGSVFYFYILFAISLGRVVVPSPKIDINLPITYEKLLCKGKPNWLRGQRDFWYKQTNKQKSLTIYQYTSIHIPLLHVVQSSIYLFIQFFIYLSFYLTKYLSIHLYSSVQLSVSFSVSLYLNIYRVGQIRPVKF